MAYSGSMTAKAIIKMTVKKEKKKIGKKRQTHKQQQQQQQNPTKNTNYGIIKTTAWDGGKVEMTCHSLAIFPHESFIDDCS